MDMLSRFRGKPDPGIETGRQADDDVVSARDDATDGSQLLARYPTSTGRPASFGGKRISMWPS